MNIDEIIPYERNARHNEKAIPVVAESIKEFGLRGQIVLESREKPVIVAGHTRVAACKSLGWTEIPDENIAYCDGLTEEQIKAFRLADNRTGEVATWNKGLLQSEMRAIGDALDMSKFKFEFKSKTLPYGAERLRTDNFYNLGMVNYEDCAGRFDMPVLLPSNATPTSLIAFKYCMAEKNPTGYIHFFIDDYQFERLWNKPDEYLPLLKKFDGCLTPDFSLYLDMPLPMQQWNEYRSRALGNFWQRNGIDVIHTLKWSDPRSYAFCFEGVPKHSAVAVSTVGISKDPDDFGGWKEGMDEAMRVIQPKKIICYGKEPDYDFGGTEVVYFAANTFLSNKSK